MAARVKDKAGQEGLSLLGNPDPDRVHLEAGALTAGNLALHTASLGEENDLIAARTAAYSRRQDARKAARKQRAAAGTPRDRNNFLSNVPEVEADVQFRFNFVVVGPDRAAEKVAKLVCNSAAARRLLGNQEEPAGPAPASPADWAAGTPVAHRCMCEVTASSSKASAPRQMLAKLIFNPMELGKDLPACTSRLEALGTVVAFVLQVDEPQSFAEQLDRLTQTVGHTRAQTHPKFRPVRAVILCSESGEEDVREEAWVSALADFERAQGDAWKFGPLSMQDGDALHTIFAEMATTRISMGHGGCASGTGVALEEAYEEGGKESEQLERKLLEEQMDARNEVSRANKPPASARSPSVSSEGWQQPPVFEAECDGSECSRDALDRHAVMCGVSPQEIVLEPKKSFDSRKDKDPSSCLLL